MCLCGPLSLPWNLVFCSLSQFNFPLERTMCIYVGTASMLPFVSASFSNSFKMESADCVDVDRREDTIFQHKVDGNVRELQLEDKCNIGLNKEVIWIVKDGQSECPRQRLGSRPSQQTSQITAPISHSYVECRYCRHTIQRHHSHRMTT